MTSEAQIERKVCSFAKVSGWLVFKWVSPNNRGVPDRIFIKDGRLVMVEFKALGKKPTPLQKRVLDKLINEKMEVHVINDIEQGKELFS